MSALPRLPLPPKHAARPLALLMLALATTACAHPRTTTPEDARLVRLDVVDRDGGAPWPQYRHGREAWVAGEDGQPYALRLTNQTGARVLVVLSVDGVNVITGETAAPSQSGYVLEPYASAEIDGWRKSMHEVAAFRFSSAAHSYAARTGRPFDLGVIGAAVFREAVVPDAWPSSAPPIAGRQGRQAPAGSAAEGIADAQRSSEAVADAPAAASPLGTAHGERRWSPTSTTRFIRAGDSPDEVIGLRYERMEQLVARGVIRRERRWDGREPRAFPAGFVPDP